ncbi:hypothetical protein UF75_5279 [Desulfosporosinus sp. I2]|nr:hypothetical protein [Desulfosporosinus sp. I2]KJR44339.1 hypothetical protein UF75_5279 [Desulfosporosinus sp. I2]
MVIKKFPHEKDPNPNTKPIPSRPEDQPSMDSRDVHGLSKEEALRSKK